MNADVARAHRATNTAHTLLLLGAMGVVFVAVGYLMGGVVGATLALVFSVVTLGSTPRIAPSMIMRLYRARAVSPNEMPELSRVVRELSARAGLESAPRLYYIPSQMMNAFTVGDRSSSAIGVTDGILRALNLRELTGVLAHEIAHVRNSDMRVMMLADMISRMASTFQLLAIISIVVMGGRGFVVALILLATPWAMSLLQLALSRTREFDADLGAVELLGDPEGLARALQKMERYQRSLLDHILPGRRVPDPSLLRSHPNTEERIQRLLELAGKPDQRPPAGPIPVAGTSFAMPPGMAAVSRPPRWHASCLWF